MVEKPPIGWVNRLEEYMKERSMEKGGRPDRRKKCHNADDNGE